MKKIEKLASSIKKEHLFILGLGIILLAQIPMLILGVDAIVPYHDQLDGEIIAYIYRAKYLFSGENVIPEFMNGMSASALTPPAPLAVILFRRMSPFAAYVMMVVLGQVIAFAGMFLLIEKLTGYGLVALTVGGLYAFLPFLPLYGLSQYGVPMLLVCFLYLWEKRYTWQSLLYIGFYAAMSSLVLCGFVWVILLGLSMVFLLFTNQIQKRKVFVIAFFEVTLIYLLFNLSLVSQILGIGDSMVSHKSEYLLTGAGFFELVKEYLIEGGDHSVDYHKYFVLIIVAAISGAVVFKKNRSATVSKYLKLILGLLGCILVLCSVAALWNCHIGVLIRDKMGSLGAFQFSRVLWIAPAIWYLILALSMAVLCEQKNHLKWIGSLIYLIIAGFVGITIFLTSPLKSCMQEILLPEYETISWSDYFAIGVMDQVETYIYENEGLDQSEYRVASLGVDPVAALYHGFYTVDGYSNNYDVNYKHAFREVIAPELERNDWLREYYDGWGNRCYLFSAEIPGYYNIEKGSFWYNDLQINTAVLKDLGCDYILSAAYIVNAEDLNLKLLREDPFVTEESYYRIYIYKLQ